MKQKHVVLIANKRVNYTMSLDNIHYERATEETIQKLIRIIESKFGETPTLYSTIQEFIANIATHQDDLVFSKWCGNGGKSHKSYVASICEAYGLSLSPS